MKTTTTTTGRFGDKHVDGIDAALDKLENRGVRTQTKYCGLAIQGFRVFLITNQEGEKAFEVSVNGQEVYCGPAGGKVQEILIDYLDDLGVPAWDILSA
jgi:hypothetical protein